MSAKEEAFTRINGFQEREGLWTKRGVAIGDGFAHMSSQPFFHDKLVQGEAGKFFKLVA